MIVEILIGSMAVIVVFALFLLQADTSENETATTADANTATGTKLWTRLRKYAYASNAVHRQPVPSKEVILAMAQKNVYWFEDKKDETDLCAVDENRQWAQELIGSSCNKLDTYQTNVILLQDIINKYCDRIEKIIDEYQEKICEFNNTLTTYTQARYGVEEDVYRKPCDDADQKSDETKENGCRSLVVSLPASMSDGCPVDIAANTNEDDLLSVYDKFVDGNL